MQTFETKFELSRSYLAECFDQSLPYGKNAKPNFLLPTGLVIAGIVIFLFIQQGKLIGSMLIAFSALEFLSIRYRRTWWITRQLWGNTANQEVKLTIDNDGVTAKNSNSTTTLLWVDIERIIETELGLILVAKAGRQQYLSKSLFSDDFIRDILAKQPPLDGI